MSETKKIAVAVTGEGRVATLFTAYARSQPDAYVMQATHQDCRDERGLEGEYLVHIGARVFADRSVVDPLPYVQDNVLDTVSLLEVVRRRRGATRFIYLSTIEAAAPKSPYAGTKAAAEALVRGWANAYGFSYMIIRSPNLYIPDYKDKGFVGRLLRCEIKEPSHPTRRRQWLDGDDFAEQLWNLMQTDSPNRTVTLGGKWYADEEIALRVEGYRQGIR